LDEILSKKAIEQKEDNRDDCPLLFLNLLLMKNIDNGGKDIPKVGDAI
jgi:hypothetical protein